MGFLENRKLFLVPHVSVYIYFEVYIFEIYIFCMYIYIYILRSKLLYYTHVNMCKH